MSSHVLSSRRVLGPARQCHSGPASHSATAQHCYWHRQQALDMQHCWWHRDNLPQVPRARCKKHTAMRHATCDMHHGRDASCARNSEGIYRCTAGAHERSLLALAAVAGSMPIAPVVSVPNTPECISYHSSFIIGRARTHARIHISARMRACEYARTHVLHGTCAHARAPCTRPHA